MSKKNVRIDNVNVYSSTAITIVLVLVESTESQTIPVRDSSESLKCGNSNQVMTSSAQATPHSPYRECNIESDKLTQGAPFSISDAHTTESRSTYLTSFKVLIASRVLELNLPE